MDVFKKYTLDQRNTSDEFYSKEDLIEEHIDLALKYLPINKDNKFSTCFGDNNPYTTVLRNHGFDVKEYKSFEELIASGEIDRILIDNPPFSTASKDRVKLEINGFHYVLLGSGTWLPKSHKYGMILFEQPRKHFTNRKEQVLCSLFHNFNENIYSEYNKKNQNKYKKDFIAVNLNKGTYLRRDIS